MDSATLALVTRLFEENAALRKENDELKSKIAPVKAKKVKEVDPNKPKKKYGKLDEETLAAVRRENGLKLAAWRKAKKESETEEPSETEDSTEEPANENLMSEWEAFKNANKKA
jgi:hypothetical protein